jgi:DNA repair exonuclease SbcCD ATPase subunit
MGEGIRWAIFPLAVLVLSVLVAGPAQAQETPRGDEVVRIDEILKAYSKASENVKASSRKVERVKKMQADLLARLKAGKEVSEGEKWEVKEQFVDVLFDQYNAFKKLSSFEYEIVGALKRIQYKIQSQERYLSSVIQEIDELIDRYKRSIELLRDRIKVEENVEGATSERVRSLRRQSRTLDYMLTTYKRFGEYASKVNVVHKKQQKDFGNKLKIFGEKLGQLPYIVQSLKSSLRTTLQIYQTSEIFNLPGLSEEVKTFINEAEELGFGKDFEDTLKVMSDMPEIFSASLPKGPTVSPEEKKALAEEFRKIEKKYRK